MTDSNRGSAPAVALHGAAVAAILKLIEGQSLMSLATNSPQGQPHISTVGYANDGLNLYFVTGRGSEKRRNILADCRVAVAIRGQAEEGEAVGLSIEGRAEPIESLEVIQALLASIEARTPNQAPWAPGHEDAVVFKVIPQTLKAVAVVDGRSHAASFFIGADEEAVQPEAYTPSAVARLF